LWPLFLLFGIALDAATTYLAQVYRLGEFNVVANQLMEVTGPVPAIVATKVGLIGIVLAFYLLYRRFKYYPFYAVCVSYAAFSWVPGLHNLLLLYGVPSNPVAALALQFSASFALYLHLVFKKMRIQRKTKSGIQRRVKIGR